MLYYIGFLNCFLSADYIIILYYSLSNILSLLLKYNKVYNEPEMKLLNRLVVEMKKVQECVVARKQRSNNNIRI